MRAYTAPFIRGQSRTLRKYVCAEKTSVTNLYAKITGQQKNQMQIKLVLCVKKVKHLFLFKIQSFYILCTMN